MVKTTLPARRGTTLLILGLLIGLNLLAHFLPFERVSAAWDDYQYLTPLSASSSFDHAVLPTGVPACFREASRAEHVRGFLLQPGRPLMVVWPLMDWFVGENKTLWVTVVFAASTLLTVSLYFLFAELLGQRSLALLFSAFFVVLPNKPQLYHLLIYWFITTTYAIVAASLTLYLVYLRSSRRIFLWLALLCYGITLFTYEIAVFLPVIAFVAALFYGRRKWWTSLLFLIPLGLNVLWRSGLLTGHDAVLGPSQPFLYLRHHLTITVPNLYVGRGMIKWILYGLARFPTMEFPWVPLLLIADGALLWVFFRWLRKGPLAPVPARAIPVAVAMAIFFLVPSVLISYIENRHTALASLGFLTLLLAALHRLAGWRPWVLTLLLGVGLVVCQGTAWNQVVSCRINNAIAETFLEKKQSILQAKQVLIDQKSFAENIPYTWVKDPINQMDDYWGVGGLLGRGFKDFLTWVLRKEAGRECIHRVVEIARTRVKADGKMYAFEVFDLATEQFQRSQLPQDSTVLIDYEGVYPDGFHHGRRR